MDPSASSTPTSTVVVSVGPHLIGLPTSAVREMFVLRTTARPPGLSHGQRGVVTLRSKLLPVFDLRMILGLPAASAEVDELLALLRAREQEHREWIDELEASVREGRPFAGAVDPSQCAFGRWYRSFRTENVVLAGQLRRFEHPHARIHALAEAREGLLSELVGLFETARQVIVQEQREIGVVVGAGGRLFVLAVDGAEAVKQLEPFEGEGDPLADSGLEVELIEGLARWSERRRPVFLLDLRRLSPG